MLDFSRVFIAPPDTSLLYTGYYDPILVSLSLAVAIFASYAGLLVSQHVTSTTAVRMRRMWLTVGGLCLGLGIWGMHFVGMLAFSLPCATGYNAWGTLLSMVPGVLACTLALKIISRGTISRMQLGLGGVLLGSGIGAMHYTGMAAMRLEGLIRYDIRLFALSIVVAVALATLAIGIKFRLQNARANWRKWVPAISALVMGMAVSGMHYTAMAAAYFIREGDKTIVDSQIGTSFLALTVLAATSVIIIVTLVATYVARPNLLSLGHSYKLIGFLIMGWSIAAWFSADYYHDHHIDKLYQQELEVAAEQAVNVVTHIDENLELLKAIPLMFSRNTDVQRTLRRFGSHAAPSAVPYETRRKQWTQDKELVALNHSLDVAATHLRADVIWVLNAAGDTVASSNFDKSDSFVGSNYREREYFRKARSGQPGHQYAVGWTSKLPGLYYSHPVFENKQFIGAVIVKRNISNFSPWMQQAQAFITDANGVIVLATDKKLEFKALPRATVANLSSEKRTGQYGKTTFETLKIEPWNRQRQLFTVRVDGSDTPAIMISRNLAEDMISFHVLRPLSEMARIKTERTGLFVLIGAAGSMLIVAASAIVLYLRQSRRMEADLRVAATAFESQEGMIITDADNVILRVNRAFTDITGYTPQEVIGQTPSLFKSGRHDSVFYAAMWESIERIGSWQGEVLNRRKNGEVFPEWLTITAVRAGDGAVTHYVAALTDMTERKAAADEIARLAFYDSLTYLPNRRLLLDRLHQALASSTRSGRQGALLFIDLDNFKTLNDTRGHDQGDLLLQQVAQRLMDGVREDDTVARLGGDEFVLMLEDLSGNPQDAASQTQTVGEKILARLNEPYLLGDYEYHITPSIGITLFADHHDTVDELLKRADLAMYQAKAAGRNTLRFFDPHMQAAVTARATLETELRLALREQQFLLHYQGQVNERGALIGAEALVRWQNPRLGLVFPGDFISLAEETGLILPLGQWVLETACAQLVDWAARDETAHLDLSINVSARQFRHSDFVAHVLAVLDTTGANPRKLKLEITESLMLDDVEDTIAKMTALKARGVGFSLDDFGTGYSSLSYLKRLPLDQLKIDQSFVRDVFTDANDAAIVKTIMALAKSLDLSVIAEGVETEAQRDFLAALGCHVYQGYLFGRPESAQMLGARLAGVPQ